MRNLKRALSLGLTAAMISGLMVMGSSAASYADVTSENNVEAIDVLEAVGIMVGDENGNFNPDQNVTRNEMAVVMANLMEYNVASYKDTSPFTDVPSWAEPYVAACWTNGITAGYSDTIYGGSDTVTTAQAALMLMKALGYFQYASDFGGDWQLATTRQGNAIDLFDGVDSGVTQAMTRNDVAQLVLNTLQAGTVQASTDGSWSIGDVVINNNVQYDYITSNQAYASAIDNDRTTNNDGDLVSGSIVELGEQLYQGDLKLTDDTIDDFGRPSRTWSYDGSEIGTYAKQELLIASYTEGVTGREMYNLLSSATIRDSELYSYVDGAPGEIVKNNLVRSNDDDLKGTGTGVLTEVYLDLDTDEITIASINTYLAKANGNYNTNTESASLNVYANDADGATYTVDVEEVPNVVDVTEDSFYLVRMTKMDVARGEVVELYDAEVLEDSTVTKFSTGSDGLAVDKLTVDGTEYEATVKAFYDSDTLNEYDHSLLTDMSYNVYLDLYGNAIGVELYEGTLNYVFITGYDRTASNISIRTADAAAIFVDGTMDVITVNVSDTNKNIDKLDGDDDNNNGDDQYYEQWVADGDQSLNRWYTYTVTESGVYTLKPVGDGERMFVSYYNDIDDATHDPTVINSSNVRLDDMNNWNGRAYGNDDSVYITAEAGKVDKSEPGPSGNLLEDAITDVTGVYTGVQEVEIELTASARGDVTDDATSPATAANVYTVFDSDNYIIASIVLGDAQGNTANYAYILSEAKSEGKDGDNYYWEFDAILNGEKQTLTARSEYPSTIDALDVDTVQELRFDGDYVVSVRDIDDPNDIYDTTEYSATQKIDSEEVYFVMVGDDDGDASNAGQMRLIGRTLYSSDVDAGLTLTSDATAVVRQRENGSVETTNYGSVSEAISALGDANELVDGKQYDGTIVAVLNDQGVAEWVFFDSETPIYTGSQGDYGDDNSVTRGDATLVVETGKGLTAESVRVSSAGALSYTFGTDKTGPVSYDYVITMGRTTVANGTVANAEVTDGKVLGNYPLGTLYEVGDDVVITISNVETVAEAVSMNFRVGAESYTFYYGESGLPLDATETLTGVRVTVPAGEDLIIVKDAPGFTAGDVYVIDDKPYTITDDGYLIIPAEDLEDMPATVTIPAAAAGEQVEGGETEDKAVNLTTALTEAEGDIYLTDGYYTLNANTTLNEDITIYGNGATIETQATDRGLMVGNGADVTIEGVNFVAGGEGIAIKENAGNTEALGDLIIRNCTFEGYTTAIHIAGEGFANISIIGCAFDSELVDISLTGCTGTVLIEGNTYSTDNTLENINVMNIDMDKITINDEGDGIKIIWPEVEE